MNLSICPYDWKTKKPLRFCFADATADREPKFDSPRPPVPQPVGHIREMTHRPKSEPKLGLFVVLAQVKESSRKEAAFMVAELVEYSAAFS